MNLPDGLRLLMTTAEIGDGNGSDLCRLGKVSSPRYRAGKQSYGTEAGHPRAQAHDPAHGDAPEGAPKSLASGVLEHT